MKRDHQASEALEKMGTKAFVDMAMQSNTNEKTGFQKDRGIRGRVRHRLCSHGIWVVEDYKNKQCAECSGLPKGTKQKDFKPYFNQGLGHFVTSRSEEKRIAKSMGLVEAG